MGAISRPSSKATLASRGLCRDKRGAAHVLEVRARIVFIELPEKISCRARGEQAIRRGEPDRLLEAAGFVRRRCGRYPYYDR
jgi:hypothetical protein